MIRVLQAANAGPDGNSLYVLRVEDNSVEEVCRAVVVDVRGAVVHSEQFLTESGARTRANALYTLFRKHNGDWKRVQEEMKS